MFSRLAFLISICLTLSTLAQPARAALPTDEQSIESDLEEDDGSATPSAARPDPIIGDELPASEIKPAQEVPLTPPAAEVQPNYRRRNDTAESYRPSGSSGEKVFDWSKHQGETEVKHPFAEKGLIKIGKDKTYYYKIKESDQTRAASFHVGPFNPVKLGNPETGATFDQNYDQSQNPALVFEYEWQGWNNPLGKFGIRAGTGLFVAQGHGHFVHTNLNPGKTPREQFTFLALPNSLGAVYRMQLWHRQLVVPYAEGGGLAWTFSELRDDDKGPKFGGALGAYAAAGFAFNLTYFDYLTRIQLDREYGINACYLTLEYRHVFSFSKFDFESDFINGGFLMEY